MPPFSPENLHVVSTDKGQISLEWQPAKETTKAPVDGYIIEMANGDTREFKRVGRVDGNTCNFDVTGLKDGQKYNFRIKAQNPSGTSDGCAQLDSWMIAAPSDGERY